MRIYLKVSAQMYFNALNKTVRRVLKIFNGFLEDVRQKALLQITTKEQIDSTKDPAVYSSANSIINLKVFTILSKGFPEGSGAITAPITNYVNKARSILTGKFRLPHDLQRLNDEIMDFYEKDDTELNERSVDDLPTDLADRSK